MTKEKKPEPAPKPWRALIYGESGVGKSTVASKAPAPYYIDLDIGVTHLGVRKSEPVETYAQFMEEMTKAFKDDKTKTVVVDTLSLLEPMVEQHVLDKYGVQKLNQIEWGGGFTEVKNIWGSIIKMFKKMSTKKNVICITHSTTGVVDDVMHGQYQRIEPELGKKVLPNILAAMDLVVFCTYKFNTVAKGQGTGMKRAIGDYERVLKLDGSPLFIAKSRFNTPPEMSMNDDLFGVLK